MFVTLHKPQTDTPLQTRSRQEPGQQGDCSVLCGWGDWTGKLCVLKLPASSSSELRKLVSATCILSDQKLPAMAVFPVCRPCSGRVSSSLCSEQTHSAFYRKSPDLLALNVFFFYLEQGKNSLKFFSSSGLICSFSLRCREVFTVVYYLVKEL